MQRCLRQLWLTKARYDLEIHVIYVPDIHNVSADCLSRCDMDDSYPRRFSEDSHSKSKVSAFKFTQDRKRKRELNDL